MTELSTPKAAYFSNRHDKHYLLFAAAVAENNMCNNIYNNNALNFNTNQNEPNSKKSQDTAENLKQNVAIGSILTSVVSSTRTLFEHNLIFRPTNNIDFWKYMLIPER